jgi:hypothetical protein
VDFVAGNFKQIAKIGFGWKNQFNPHVFTLLNLENFNSKNVKNEECVHTWGNSTGYTRITEITL